MSNSATKARREPVRRDPENGVLGGVCAGIARRLGLDPLIARGAMVLIALLTSGIGAIGYLVAWAAMQPLPPESSSSNGQRRRAGSWRIATGVGLLALSVLLVFRQLDVWWSDALIWPLVLACFGVALLWSLSRKPPEPQERERRQATPAPEGGARRLSLMGFGVTLVLGAGLLFLWANGALKGIGDIALAGLVVIVALALILAPFWWRLARNLAAERAERIRSQERAEMGAHLHDSVLQTLALMRQRADDAAGVERLARRQERELRTWLARDSAPRPDERLADALRAAAEEVEDSHGAPIEVVVVGDCALDEHLEALVAAGREALVNASKFAADGGPIRLYAEIEGREARVWVDDRGAGFDPSRIPEDRHGVRESIIGRMRRHGGSAKIRSAPGEGTEVALALERATA